MPLRIIHTADVHLDASFSSSSLPAHKGRLKREAIRATFRRIIDDCLAWPADALVIPGDTFEDELVTADTIGFMVTQFRRLGNIPVIIAPGNHDPYRPNGAYNTATWSPNVHIFSRPSMDSFDFPSLGVTFYGCAHDSPHTKGRLTDIIQRAPSESPSLSVLVVHANDTSNAPPDESDDWLPFTRDELLGLHYDYTALGHLHTAYEIADDRGRPVAAYPGCPEALRLSETNRRHYSHVTLDRDTITIQKVPVSEIDYVKISISCDAFQTRDQFFTEITREAMSLLPVSQKIIAHVTATGRVVPGFHLCVDPPEEIANRFFHLVIDDQTVPDYDWEKIESESSLRGEVARNLRTASENADAESRVMLQLARVYAVETLDGRSIDLPAEVLRVD